MSKVIKVTGCRDCVFAGDFNMGDGCYLANRLIAEVPANWDIVDGWSPDWCPLRGGPVIVEMEWEWPGSGKSAAEIYKADTEFLDEIDRRLALKLKAKKCGE